MYGRIDFMENIYEELSIANVSSFIIFSFGDLLEKEAFVWIAAVITVFALGFNLYALRKAYSRGEQSAKVKAVRKTINQVLFSLTLLVLVFTKVFILHS